MAWKKVDNYRLGFSPIERNFYFYYKLAGETTVHQFFPSPQEFLGLSDMFRNEGPIHFNTDGRYFITAAEDVGEEEAPP